MTISIIIPAYKAEHFIEPLLNNISTQIVNDNLSCEVIVVNDGSPDSTKDIAKNYCAKYSFIKLINQDNKGESGARNTGIENASGEYLYFLDSDDSIKDGSLKHFLYTIQKEPDVDVYCFAYISKKNGHLKKKFDSSKLDCHKFNRIDFQKAYLAKYLPIHICSCVIKKKLVNQCKLRFSVGLRIGADIEWLLKLASVVQTAYFSNRICYVYQIRNDSIMQGYKTYSLEQYHSFEIRRDIILSEKYRSNELSKYANFWIENQLLSNIIYYLKSNVKDHEITKKLIDDCKLLRLPVNHGNNKNLLAIYIAKILPLRLFFKVFK